MSVKEIIPGLWLSDKNISLNKQFFKDNQIDIVINCSKDLQFIDLDIEKVRLKIHDNLQDDEIINMYHNLDYITKYIYNNLLLCKNILVHCYAGKQRSATVIIAYLLRYSKLDLNKCIELLKYKKENVFTPSINFIDALKLYNKDINI
tara:strand:+ start:436 stop:879 length:444 start_codon:yes stop_codon:yes gene_type:complete